MRFKPKGFTLMELMIVIALVALLVLALILSIKGQIVKGRDAKRKADVHLIKTAVEEYEKDHDCYPAPELIACGNSFQPYLPTILCDPFSNEAYVYEVPEDGCPRWFRIYSRLENLKDTGLLPGIGPSGSYNYYVSSPNAPLPSGGATPAPTSLPTSTPIPGSGYYGCIDSTCVPVPLDSEGSPLCSPNWTDVNCSGTDCLLPWNNCIF